MSIHQVFKKSVFLSFRILFSEVNERQAGGENANIIPGNAVFSIDVREGKNPILFQLKDQIEKDLEALQKLFDIEIEWEWYDLTPGAEVSKEALAIARGRNY